MEENNMITNQIDTSTFANNIMAPTTQVDGLNQSTIPTTTVAIPEFKNPKIVDFANEARFDISNRMMGGANKADSIVSSMFPDKDKLDLTTTVDVRDTHTQLSNSNTWIPKYKSYLPGVDNDARLSAMQSDTEKFFNPIKRLVANTSKAPLDLIGSVYGIGAAALSGRFDAIYDNDYMHWLDNWTERTNFDYKNYYNEEQRNQSLGLNLQTLDKVLGGAEFTTRLIAAEGLLAVATGGASLPASFAKTGLGGGVKMAKILDKGAEVAKTLKFIKAPEMMKAAKMENVAGKGVKWFKEVGASEDLAVGLNRAAKYGEIGEFLVKTRFAVTSPLYEAGFESRHFQKEAEKSFWDYYREKGVDPTPEEVTAFSKKLSGAADGVFITNMAILAPSNLAMLGNVLNLSNPLSKAITSSGKGVSERLFGMGIKETADGTFKALKATGLQKTAAYLNPIAKGFATEGVFEEGGQGIASATYKNYVASSYNPEYAKNTANYIDAFGKAFTDQFGTKEGQEEVIIGGIIGALFGGIGAVRGGESIKNQYKKQERTADILNAGGEFSEAFKSNAYTNEWMLSLFSQGNRFQKLQEALQKAEGSDNKLEQASLQAQAFVSMVDAYHSVGKSDTFMDTMTNVIKGLDNQSIAEQTGLDISEVDSYKNEQIQNMQEMSDSYGKALKAGRYIFGTNTAGTSEVKVKDDKGNVKSHKVNGELLANALAFSTTMAGFNEKFALQSFDAIQNKIALAKGGQTLLEKLGAAGALKSLTTTERNQLSNLNTEVNKHREQIAVITDKIVKLENSEDKNTAAQQRVQLGKDLANAQLLLSEAESKADIFWKSSVDNFYSKMNKQGYAQRPELDTFTDQVNEINQQIDDLRLEAADKMIVENLFKQFETANEAHKSFVDMATNIQNAEFTPKTFKGMFGGLRARWYEKSVNEHTKDTLAEIFEFSKSSEASKKTTRNKLTENEIETPEVIITDPLNHLSQNTIIDTLYLERRGKEQELYNLRNGVFSEDLQKKIDALENQIQTLENEIAELENQTVEEIEDTELESLNREIEVLEKEIENDERNSSVRVNKKFNRKVKEKEYQQYEYVKPNGDVVIGTLEENKNILQIVNENEIVDIQELKVPLRKTDVSSIKGLKKIEEDDVLIEGNEVYVNGKIYKMGLKNPTLDESISKDKNGNYQVTLQARNGRMITLKGSTADAIVYQHLLIKLEQDATEQQIRELREQAERDSEIERKYEKLASKTENRDTRIDEINLERENADSRKEEEIDNKRKLISDLGGNKTDVVIAEEIKLTNELAKINGEVSIEESLNRLQESSDNIRQELAELNGTDPESEEIDILNRKLTQTELEISKINTERNSLPFNPNTTPSEQLEWVVSNLSELNLENIDAASKFEKPSKEEIDEYVDLIDIETKNPAQKKRTAELREKLTPFLLMDGLSLDGTNILDIIDLYNQTKEIKAVKENQIQESSEDDIKKVVKTVEDVTLQDEYRSEKVTLVYDGAYIKKKNGSFEISHIKLATMLIASLESGFKPTISIRETDAKGNKKVVEEIEITFDNVDEFAEIFDNMENIKVTVSPENTLVKNKDERGFTINGDLQPFLEMLDLRAYAITGQPTNYVLLYERKIDGTYGVKEAEYSVKNRGVNIDFNKDVLNSIKPGDKVTLEFDPSDDYNKTLRKKEWADKGNIYVKKNGELVQILKATTVKNTKGNTSELQALRAEVINNPDKIIQVEVEKSYMGFPIITLDDNGNAREIPLDDSKVIAYGHVDENGVIKGDISKIENIDNMRYVTALSKTGKKTPVVAFKNNGKTMIFPINVKPKGVDLSADVDDIIGDDSKSQQRKMIEINSLLEQHDLLSPETALTTINFDVTTVKQTLSQVYDRIDVTDVEQLKEADKTAYIDLNNPFMASKLVLNFGSIKTDHIEELGKITKTIVKSTVRSKNQKGSIQSNIRKCKT